MLPNEAEQYLKHLVDNEMPLALKKYVELQLFPQIHLRITWGISLSMAQWWLHHEGFQYTSHKKGLYFDGT